MKLYAEIINQDTKECRVINQVEAENLGWIKYDLEVGYDCKFYLQGYAPLQPLDELKQAKLVELKFMRDTLEVAPISYKGNSFDYDEKARDRINAAIIALDMQSALSGSEASLSWTTADNTEAEVTANDLRGIIANVALRSNELHIKYRELKELVDAVTTKEELEAIQWA